MDSPRERAAQDLNALLNRMIYERGQFGIGAAETQASRVLPIFNRAIQDVASRESAAQAALSAGLSAQLAGIGQQAGESLLSSGIARGANTSSAFATALAPAIASTQQARAGISANFANMLGDIQTRQALTLADLLKSSDALSAQYAGLLPNAISGMKGTTTLGDILGLATTLGSLALPIGGALGWTGAQTVLRAMYGGGR